MKTAVLEQGSSLSKRPDVLHPDNLYLIPTAEVPVTNLYRDVIVDAGNCQLKYSLQRLFSS
jgi:seryl-tRNA synthetase